MLEIPVLEGRDFTDVDSGRSPPIAIISQSVAQRFFPGQDPIGRRLYSPTDLNDLLAITDKTVFYTVVGVIRDVKLHDMAEGEKAFQSGAAVEAYFGSRFAYAAYRDDFLQLDQVRLSGSFWLSGTKLSARLSSGGGILDENGQPVVGERMSEGKLNLPVPLLGFQVEWAVSQRSVIQMFSRVIFIDVSDIRGGMSQNTFRYHFYVFRNAALGIGYDSIRCALQKYRTDDYTLRANYGIQGFTFYLRGAF